MTATDLEKATWGKLDSRATFQHLVCEIEYSRRFAGMGRNAQFTVKLLVKFKSMILVIC